MQEVRRIMAGVGKLGPGLKLLLVVVLVASASDGSDASRLPKGAPTAAGEQHLHSSNGGLVASSAKLAVGSKASAGHSGCTFNPNNSGRRCP
ncbi:hypothetical protein GQ55_9G097200 [Panicum hallii var. hallii]|jgi:hypothetical protein|uniref:Uncharacterized protein n=2 Tax=Panicum hallii TaxID=206008 RepID=A0A2T7C1E9_9POAL|nr:hypothetical protein PAHAL_9G100100 [Panicum hallii]PUZ37169.1 hypothetical protein GQ55_9G097200 [Panicum hallii var. hallii]